jgi:hypothetical protein
MTSQVCHAAARPPVKAHPERAKALLGCFLHMAELARVDGALAFPMDFPTFVQGVMGALVDAVCVCVCIYRFDGSIHHQHEPEIPKQK